MFTHFFPHFSILGVTPSPVYGLAMFGQSPLPHQLPFSYFSVIPPFYYDFFCFPLTLSILSIRIGFVFFYSSLIFFAIVLCIPLFTFLSLVRIMDRFSTFVLIDEAIFPPRSFPSVATHTSL